MPTRQSVAGFGDTLMQIIAQLNQEMKDREAKQAVGQLWEPQTTTGSVTGWAGSDMKPSPIPGMPTTLPPFRPTQTETRNFTPEEQANRLIPLLAQGNKYAASGLQGLQAMQPKIVERDPYKSYVSQNPFGGETQVQPAQAKPEAKPQDVLKPDGITPETVTVNGQVLKRVWWMGANGRPQFGTVKIDDTTSTAGVLGSNQGFDGKAIAKAIESGDQPPIMTGLSRGQGGVVKSELAKLKYDLSTTTTDWSAVQVHYRTLNNPQQTRLRQAAQTAYDSFGVIEELSNEWKGKNFPLLNKANLLIAKQGGYGQEAASVATRLEAQINDVIAEMSQVYMAGNTPTDQALKLASHNLSADWSHKVLKDALELGRRNMRIRLNSINTIGTLSPSGANNQYIGQGANQQINQQNPSTTDQFEVGKVYVDAQGNKATYLGNGNWK